MIDTSCKTPPAYFNGAYSGLPLNAIFVEFMQN